MPPSCLSCCERMGRDLLGTAGMSGHPTKIGKYEVAGIIGRGGMGVVYKAVDPQIGRFVAIKMITAGFSGDQDLLKRFYREAHSTGSLQNPNIVTVFDLGQQDGNPYLVMEYLEGISLESILSSRRPLSLIAKLKIILDICHGLSYAHQRGVIHRDIKPANIMVTNDGVVKIVDFGIAHMGDKGLTRTGQVVGSLSFMSPEQLAGKNIDAQTDIFSTGVVLYQLITNILPFEGESTAATLMKIINEPPPPLKNYLTSYPPELETITERALAKNRDARYTTADDFAADVAQLLEKLKPAAVAEHLQEAEVLLAEGELFQAEDQLVQLLKIDRQNTRATQLLREIQKRLKGAESMERVQKLRVQAEEAYAQQRFDSALSDLNLALKIDRENPSLLQLRDRVAEAHLRVQKVQHALQAAELAHQQRQYSAAKQAVKEALNLAPHNTRAQALSRAIEADWQVYSRFIEENVAAAQRLEAEGRIQDLVGLLEAALARAGDEPRLRSLLLMAREKLGPSGEPSLQHIGSETGSPAATLEFDSATQMFGGPRSTAQRRTGARSTEPIHGPGLHTAADVAPPVSTLPVTPPANRGPLFIGVGAVSLVAILVVAWAVMRPRTKIDNSALVSVEIATSPQGASVRLKGTNQECTTPHCLLSLAPGTYEVEAQLSGFESANQAITVSSAGPNSVEIALHELPRSPASETLSSNMENEGTSVGQTPAKPRINRPTVIPPAPADLSAEQTDWKRAKTSQTIDEVNQFLQKYPAGAFHTEAESKREDLYWAKDNGADNPAALRDYLRRYPAGKYLQTANTELSRLDWQAIANTRDPAVVENYLKLYSSGEYHDRAYGRLDDLLWEGTGRGDNAGSLRSYLQTFPSGRHADQANREMAQLTAPKATAIANPPNDSTGPPRSAIAPTNGTTSLPATDDKTGVLNVLSAYENFYQNEDLPSLQRLWPRMTPAQIQGVGDFFKNASSVKLTCIPGSPKISGTEATLEFKQELTYVMNQTFQKPSRSKVSMKLKKSSQGTWLIDSIH